ncbi:MAG: aminotransferase class I/II-fold pyridoxal phosphate-dependent enzyme [Nitratireductor sp.]|nr:aminotransferase class I/II-fold pyridoxal phosphate-dependent enzyme [Nitratireductor sp.]
MPRYARLVNRIANEGSAAWELLFRAWKDQKAGEDVIVLAIGDPEFNSPEPVIAAAKQALDDGLTHYSSIPGTMELREAIAARTMRVSGASAADYSITADNVVVTQGTQGALFTASLCLLEEGDEVLALEPMYLTYEATFALNGAKVVRVACPRETGFRPRPDLIEKAITPRTRAIVYSSPNNPTGAVFTRDELRAIADIAIRHDLWVIADEVYASQVYAGEHFSIAALPGMAERTVTCGSLSKSHAMTGWRVGWVTGPAQFINHAHHAGIAMHYGIPTFVQKAALTAINQCEAEAEAITETFRRRCNIVLDRLAATPGLAVIAPQGAMYVLVDVTGTGRSSAEFATELYDAEKVAALDAMPFGASADGCIRIACTLADEVLAEACNRIHRFAAMRHNTRKAS